MARRKTPVVAQTPAEEEEEPGELLARAAAIDVAKDTGMVAPGYRTTPVPGARFSGCGT